MNLKGVKERVRALVGDPDGDFTEDAYLLPLINIAYEDVTLQTKNGSGRNLQQVIDLPDVPAASQDLKDYQAAGKQLATLTDPLFLWWKFTGQATNNYQQAISKTTLPPVAEGGSANFGQIYWTWLSNTLFMTPMALSVDLRLHGRFDPPILERDEDLIQVHPNMSVPLQYATAALIGVDRNNANWIENYGRQAMAAVDNVVADIIRQGQGDDSRFGRFNGPPECGWYWLK